MQKLTQNYKSVYSLDFNQISDASLMFKILLRNRGLPTQITLLVYELEERNERSYTGVILKRTLAVTRSTDCHRASDKLFITLPDSPLVLCSRYLIVTR